MIAIGYQKIFRAGEVSGNEGTLTNILSIHQRKTPHGKILDSFLLDAFKTAFQMRHLTHRWTQSCLFFLNSGQPLTIFKKWKTRPHPCVCIYIFSSIFLDTKWKLKHGLIMIYHYIWLA